MVRSVGLEPTPDQSMTARPRRQELFQFAYGRTVNLHR